MVGGVLQLAVQVPALRASARCRASACARRRSRAAWRHPGVRRVLRQMAPALLGVSVAQLSLLINTQIASHLGVGAVSWLDLCRPADGVPDRAARRRARRGADAAAVGGAGARRRRRPTPALLDWGLRLVLLLALPCAVALLVFPQPLVAVLFHHGAFTRAATCRRRSPALMGYGVGLMG